MSLPAWLLSQTGSQALRYSDWSTAPSRRMPWSISSGGRLE